MQVNLNAKIPTFACKSPSCKYCPEIRQALENVVAVEHVDEFIEKVAPETGIVGLYNDRTYSLTHEELAKGLLKRGFFEIICQLKESYPDILIKIPFLASRNQRGCSQGFRN